MARWTPDFSAIPLALWLDASDADTITESSGSVSQWTDKSANAYTFSQGTPGNQPQVAAASQNGLDTLSYDGSRFLLSDDAASTWSFLHDGSARS